MYTHTSCVSSPHADPPASQHTRVPALCTWLETRHMCTCVRCPCALSVPCTSVASAPRAAPACCLPPLLPRPVRSSAPPDPSVCPSTPVLAVRASAPNLSGCRPPALSHHLSVRVPQPAPRLSAVHPASQQLSVGVSGPKGPPPATRPSVPPAVHLFLHPRPSPVRLSIPPVPLCPPAQPSLVQLSTRPSLHPP